MRIIVKFEKGAQLRYLSHLDLQRAFHRAIRRAGVPIAYSQGFNPHPQTSFASALPVGQTGLSEWMEIRLEEGARMSPDDVREALNHTFPEGLFIHAAYPAPEGYPSLTSAMRSADYTAYPAGDTVVSIPENELRANIELFLSEPIMVEKRKKSKGKHVTVQTDIRPMILSMELTDYVNGKPTIAISGRLDASGGLNAEQAVKAFGTQIGIDTVWRVQRNCIHLEPKLDNRA